jgi:hypothetical protein
MSKGPASKEPRRNRGTGDRVRGHDSYQPRAKLSEPTRCPECAAHYRKGHWTWSAPSEESGDRAPHEHVCPACQRVRDDYPAGEVQVAGAFLTAHRQEIIDLVRNVEQKEKREHPLNRIMAIVDQDGELLVTTTDVHLPHRIGHALRDAWDGQLSMQYDDTQYYSAVRWERDA